MRYLVVSVNVILLIVALGTPWAVLWFLRIKKVNYKLFWYYCISIMLLVVLLSVFAWWADFSDRMLVAHYGYNWDGFGVDNVDDVLPEHKERVLSRVNGLMGVGWPVESYV